MAKSRKSKSRKPTHKVKAPQVVVAKLPPDGIVRVVVPPGAKPIIAHDPVRRVVEIVPLPEKKKAWWDFS